VPIADNTASMRSLQLQFWGSSRFQRIVLESHEPGLDGTIKALVPARTEVRLIK
jgi:hypothetical protein